ncbi:MAG: ABC transporter permease [Pseudomonadales bacterium]|jgi:putative ABC transport system permease protein|nr:ABC transporter permease [Pseudomonadales bacterium]
MLKHYITATLNNLLKNKLFSLINIIGMAVGVCCFLLIMLYVRQELNYDRGYANAERIYRISMDVHPGDDSAVISLATNAPQVAPLLQEERAEVEAAVRLLDWNTWLKREGGEPLYRHAAMVDVDFFKVFDFRWLAGDASTALNDPDSVVLTESSARKLFGARTALGEILQMEGGRSARVTGVIADLGNETHLDFDALVPMDWAVSIYGQRMLQNWTAQSFHTYVLLRKGASVAPMMAQFPAFIDRHIEEGASKVFWLITMPLVDLHLHSARRNDEVKATSSMTTVRAFIGIAIVVLLVASINFMNLATVRATRRAREVGVRKAIGASKYQVALQFLGEALLLTALAVLLGVMGAELILPAFNSLVSQQLDLDLLSNLWVLPVLMLSVALVSGSYPALYLASFRAATVLRGAKSNTATGQTLRKGLVVLQFATAVVLLVAAWVIQSQLLFARGIELGYSKERVVVLSNIGEGIGRDWDLLKQQLLANPNIVAVTASNTLPTAPVESNYYFQYEGGANTRAMPVMLVDFDYFETYGIELKAGRTFSREFSTDIPTVGHGSGAFILNELAVRQLGWTPEQAIGKQVSLSCCGMEQGTVAGVVANVQHGSVQAPQGPITYAIPPEPVNRITDQTRPGLRLITLKLSGRDLQNTLAYIDTTWKNLHPDQAMSRYFLDDEFAGLYRNEERQGSVLSIFAVLAIAITCMGLYGLSSYDALLRTKEIGVRKVLGSPVWNIVLLLTHNFSKLVLLSNLIAWPVAYFAMSRWLQNFAYRIDLTPLLFIGSGAIALCIAWVTVASTVAKAASQRPVLALRYE